MNKNYHTTVVGSLVKGSFIAKSLTMRLFPFACYFLIILLGTTGMNASGNTSDCIPAATDTLSNRKQGTVVNDSLISVVLKENKVGLSLTRKVKIYLPPGYQTSGKRYPVVYYCHSIYGNPNSMFWAAATLLDSAFSTGAVKEFIFVVADYSSPLIGSLYEN